MKKIFVIGFNKTGTCSLHFLFKKLGINSYHNTTPVMKIINKYDAFSDGEHYNFADYFNAKPDSLFILNTRPIDKWLFSRYKHAAFHNFNECWCWPVSDKRTDDWITLRETHFQNVLSFFKDKLNQLLIINIEKKGWEKAVTLFLKKENSIISLQKENNIISHINKRPDDEIDDDKMQLIKNNVITCLKNRGYNGDEILFKDVNINQYKYNTFL